MHHIKASEAKFLFTEPEIMKSPLQAAGMAGVLEQNIWMFNNLGQALPPGQKSWRGLLNHGEKDWVRFNDLKAASETAATRLFSSGTTGLAKAVTTTHYNYIAQHQSTIEVNPKPYRVRETPVLMA